MGEISFGLTDTPADEPLARGNALDDLIDDLPPEEPIDVEIPRRPGWVARCRVNVTAQETKSWQAMAIDRKWKPGDLEEHRLNQERLNACCIAETCLVLLKDGVEMTDDQGKPLSFRSNELAAKVRKSTDKGLPSRIDVVLRIFANDAHVAIAASKILEAAAEAPTDPLGRSSTTSSTTPD